MEVLFEVSVVIVAQRTSTLHRCQPALQPTDIFHESAELWVVRGTHYHQRLKPGENTLTMRLLDLVLQTIANNRGVDADAFVAAYIEFMTSPHSHNDTFVDETHRFFFQVKFV